MEIHRDEAVVRLADDDAVNNVFMSPHSDAVCRTPSDPAFVATLMGVYAEHAGGAVHHRRPPVELRSTIANKTFPLYVSSYASTHTLIPIVLQQAY